MSYITGTEWRPNRNVDRGEWGVLPLVSATLTYAFIAMIVAVPIGLMTAIYLSEYARPNVRSVAKPILEVLAGIPTIVYGFFALTFITPEILQRSSRRLNIYNVLSAGLAIGILTVPLVASLSEDACGRCPARCGRRLRARRHKVETSMQGGLAGGDLRRRGLDHPGAGRPSVGETMIIVVAGGQRSGRCRPIRSRALRR